MKKFSAVIFDMDGVIVDSEPLHRQAFETLFEELGKRHDHGIVFSDYYGRSDEALFRDFLRRHNLPHEIEDLKERKLQYLIGYLRERRPVFGELHELLPELSRRYVLAIASSSSHRLIDVVMEISGLRPHFQTIVGFEDIRFAKPDPEIYFTASRRLGVRPSACCVIEDAPMGVQAAKTAGMTVIALTTTVTADKLTRADHIAPTFADVRRILLP